MSSKLNFIPHIVSYDYIRDWMEEDLKYRLSSRHERTSLGRPLYYRINVQLITTEECPYRCPFCMERKNPMTGDNDFDAQIESLKKVLAEHPLARLTITGGEPGLYPEHVKNVCATYRKQSANTFLSINTTGYSKDNQFRNQRLDAHVNLSVNDYVKPDPGLFPGCTVQTVISDEKMRISNLKEFMRNTNAGNFSFRFLSGLDKHDYDVTIWNEIQNDPDIDVKTFRVGDFFVYCTFNWNGKHARVTLGDMYQQQHNDYKDGYSNIIIHPDGKIGVNWQ